MNNKFLHIGFALLYVVLAQSFFIIMLNVFDIMVINRIVFVCAECFMCLIAGLFLALTSFYKQRMDECNYNFEKEKDFNSSYIDSLYKQNENLRERIDGLLKENEMLAIISLSHSGKKMN